MKFFLIFLLMSGSAFAVKVDSADVLNLVLRSLSHTSSESYSFLTSLRGKLIINKDGVPYPLRFTRVEIRNHHRTLASSLSSLEGEFELSGIIPKGDYKIVIEGPETSCLFSLVVQSKEMSGLLYECR